MSAIVQPSWKHCTEGSILTKSIGIKRLHLKENGDSEHFINSDAAESTRSVTVLMLLQGTWSGDQVLNSFISSSVLRGESRCEGVKVLGGVKDGHSCVLGRML